MPDGPGGLWRRRHRHKVAGLLAAAVLVAAGMAAVDLTGAVKRLELDSVDTRFAVRGDRPAPRDLAVVAIDDVSFGELGRRWQDWPRRWHADVLRRLHDAGARVIAYDVQFTEASRDPAQDLALYRAAEA